MSIRTVRVLRFNAANGTFHSEQMPTVSSMVKPKVEMIAYKSHIHDAVLFVPWCKTHDKVLLKEFRKSLYFLPYFPLRMSECVSPFLL